MKRPGKAAGKRWPRARDLPANVFERMGRGVPGGHEGAVYAAPVLRDSPKPKRGEARCRHSVNSILEGDFDRDGQMVVQTPPERVIQRSVVVTRTLTQALAQTPIKAPVQAPKAEIKPDQAKHNTQPHHCPTHWHPGPDQPT